MKKLCAVVAVAMLFISCIAYAKDYEVNKKAGEYDVMVRIDKNPPVVGDNNMKIEIKYASGLVPIMFSHGTGADVMKRIAAPMVGGIVTSAILELIIYPVIYMLWMGKKLKR